MTRDQGWAVASQGTRRTAQGKHGTFIMCLDEHDQWKNKARDKGLLQRMADL